MVGSQHDSKASSGPVRLALIVGADTMRHIGRVIQHLAIGLLDEPMAVTLLAPESVDTSNLPTPPMQIIRYKIPRMGRYGRRAIESLADQLARRQIELLHGLDGAAHGLTRRLSDRIGLPYFLSIQSLHQAQRLTSAGEHCRAVLPASNALREAVADAGGVAGEKVYLLQPGIHPTGRPDCFSHTDRSASILAGGQFDDRRVREAVLGSFSAIRSQGRDCVFFILGAGKAEHRLRTQARELQLTHELTFVDRLGQHKLPGILRAADALVYGHSTGAIETQVLEAMAAGTAVLTGGRCVGDYVINSQTTIAYNAAATDELTGKLEELLDEPRRAVRLASAAMDYLRSHHSPAAMVATLANLYREYALRGRMLKI